MSKEQKPSIGRIVTYTCTEYDTAEQAKQSGVCNMQLKLPAIIVAVWDDQCVNLKVIQDGSVPDLWVTSAVKGDEQGNWNWPVKV